MYVTAIVLAAGKGLRSKSKLPKPLIKINSKPVIICCLEILSLHPYIKDIILVVNSGNSKEIIKKLECYRIKKIKRVVLGGARRQDSVGNGLSAIDTRTDLVLIHDSVRPFIDKETISRVIKEAEKSGAAIVGVPVKATIKEVTSRYIIKRTLPREKLWEAQTPQVFRKDLILRAYGKFKDTDVTDDASLVEKLGLKVAVIPGSYNNIKITTPEDLILAEAIAKAPDLICHTK
jgi:2-C-methyl-D-erythritol 4-phosphate cytidylyltransferase